MKTINNLDTSAVFFLQNVSQQLFFLSSHICLNTVFCKYSSFSSNHPRISHGLNSCLYFPYTLFVFLLRGRFCTGYPKELRSDFGILSHPLRIFLGMPIITSILSADSFAFLLEYLNCFPPDKGTYPQPLSFGIDNTSHYNYLNLWR
jgi:hypothetical protein